MPDGARVLLASARRELDHDSSPRSSSVRESTAGRSGTWLRMQRISRVATRACRPSAQGREGDKLALGANCEHRQLKAGVHRLRVSDCNPRPSIFSASLRSENRNGRLVAVATSLPTDSTVETRRDQAAVNTRIPATGFRLTYCCNATLGRRDFYRQLCHAVGLSPVATAGSLFYALSRVIEADTRERDR